MFWGTILLCFMGPLEKARVPHYTVLQTTLSVVPMDKVTGMMREEMKSIRDQMGTVISMSLEDREWSISIIEQEEV